MYPEYYVTYVPVRSIHHQNITLACFAFLDNQRITNLHAFYIINLEFEQVIRSVCTHDKQKMIPWIVRQQF